MSNARDKANIPALNFSSTGIDDNATSTAITIDASERVLVSSEGSYNFIGCNTVDGSDNERLFIGAGSDASSARGGLIGLYGNEYSGIGGAVNIQAGNVSTGYFNVMTGGENRLKIDNNGDISFYEDTGNTPKFVWDSSSEHLDLTSLIADYGLKVENTVHNSRIDIIASAINKNSIINFGDGDSSTIGNIDYDHADNSMRFGVNASESMRITSSGGVSIATTVTPENADLLVEGGIAQLGSKVLNISKYFNNNLTASTLLTIQVPVASVAYYIEATYISSRAPNTNSAASKVSKESYFIARNGSGYDVVLNSNLNSADYEVTTTTAGGSLVPASINAQIARGGSEANTDTQSVVIKANIGFTGNSNGGLIASFKLIMLGTIPDIT